MECSLTRKFMQQSQKKKIYMLFHYSSQHLQLLTSSSLILLCLTSLSAGWDFTDFENLGSSAFGLLITLGASTKLVFLNSWRAGSLWDFSCLGARGVCGLRNCSVFTLGAMLLSLFSFCFYWEIWKLEQILINKLVHFLLIWTYGIHFFTPCTTCLCPAS